MSAVNLSVCEALLLDLCGYRNFPGMRDEDGRYPGLRAFAVALQEVSLSVHHARATVAGFDGEFPTVREIRDAGNKIRHLYEHSNPAADWRREYGQPEPVPLAFTPDQTADQQNLIMCRQIAKHIDKQRNEQKRPAKPFYGRLEWLTAKRDLCFELNRYELAELEGRLRCRHFTDGLMTLLDAAVAYFNDDLPVEHLRRAAVGEVGPLAESARRVVQGGRHPGECRFEPYPDGPCVIHLETVKARVACFRNLTYAALRDAGRSR